MARRALTGGGVIKLPKGEVGRIAAALVKQFTVCGPAGDEASLVTPPPDYISVCAHATPKSYVCIEPASSVYWASKGDLVVGGGYNPSSGQVRLRVEADACAPRAVWARQIREGLRHELTHVADPYVRVRRTPYTKATTEADYCKYIRDPVEVAANLARVQEELLNTERRQHIRQLARKGHIRPEEVLYESPTYVNRAPCLTPKIQRRFLQMAARLWSSGKLGPMPERK